MAGKAHHKGSDYAMSSCPICNRTKLRNRGVSWKCEHCGFRCGRSWVADPNGIWVSCWKLQDPYVKATRKRYQQEHPHGEP